MPQKKRNNNDAAACADSCRSAINLPKVGHYICLSHPPSECSMDCSSCHSGICNSEHCKLVKILDDYDEKPAIPSEVHVPNVPVGKCDKCGVEQPNTHAGNQTSRDSNGFGGHCSTCSRSTTFSIDRFKNTESPSQRSFKTPPTTPVKPHSCGIPRLSEQLPRGSRDEEKSSIRPLPECCQEKNYPKEQLECDKSCHEQPPRDSRDERKLSIRPECCQENNYPNEQLESNKSSQNVKRPSDGTCRSSTALPSSAPPPEPKRCTMAGCPVPCIPEGKNLSHTNVPAPESSKIYTMPMNQGMPRRQGSNIAANANQIITSSLLRKNSTQKHKVKRRTKDSKTSIKSNASSKCKCPLKTKAQEGCECHYPPAFQHYFQCAGTITGVCCCSENK